MSEQNQYAERDVAQLDEDGNYYFRHVMAMTAEGLRSKPDIAAELGFRDSRIAALLELVRVQHEALKIALYEAESWIHDQLDGTSSLDSALSRLNQARAALAKYNEVIGGLR